jgi:hypothetical protein
MIEYKIHSSYSIVPSKVNYLQVKNVDQCKDVTALGSMWVIWGSP